jgi:hypothetical protein
LTDPRKLYRQASAILREVAFPDIEPQPDGVLANPGLTNTRGKGLERIQKLQDHEAIAFYYEAARGFLHSHRFASEVQRRIWELHSESVSVKRIESILRREGRRGRVKHEVQTVIVALRARMLNPARRGRPPRPGGCHAGTQTFAFRMQDGVWEALCYLEKRWKLSKQEVIRRLVFEAGRAS